MRKSPPFLVCDATVFLAFRSLCFKTVGCKPSGARVMSTRQNKKISMVAVYAKGIHSDTERPVLEWDCQRIRGRIGCFTPDLDPWEYFPRSCRSFVVHTAGMPVCIANGGGVREAAHSASPACSFFPVAPERCRNKSQGCRLRKVHTCKTKTSSKSSGHRPTGQERPRKEKRRTPRTARRTRGRRREGGLIIKQRG